MPHQLKNSDIISDFHALYLTKQAILRGFTDFSPVNVTIADMLALRAVSHEWSGQRTKGILATMPHGARKNCLLFVWKSRYGGTFLFYIGGVKNYSTQFMMSSNQRTFSLSFMASPFWAQASMIASSWSAMAFESSWPQVQASGSAEVQLEKTTRIIERKKSSFMG